jgi:hypothetical protein
MVARIRDITERPMRIQSQTPAALLFVVALATFLTAGCKSGSDDTERTPTETPQATVGASPTPRTAIRQEALADEPGLSEFLLNSGGSADSADFIYGDLTGSGAEEAVIPVSSGGEGGDIAVIVFGYIDGEVEELLRAEPAETSIVASIENGQLMTTEGFFAPGDPINFPSQLLHRYYAWDGSAFVIEREEQEAAR